MIAILRVWSPTAILGIAMLGGVAAQLGNGKRLPASQASANVVFKSDFSTARGKSEAALKDARQPRPWTSLRGNGRLNEVVSAQGLDFPTRNVLRVMTNAGGYSQTLRLDRGIPVPDVGESLFYRWYLRVVVPNTYTADNLTHPMQDALRNTNWEFEVVTHTNDTWTVRWALNGNRWPLNRWEIKSLKKGATYRFEFQVHRRSEATFNLHVRVYDANGRLLYDDDDVRNPAGTFTLATAPAFRFADPAELGGMNAGFNGLAGTSRDMPFVLYYQGGFCVRNDDWCGTYRNGI